VVTGEPDGSYRIEVWTHSEDQVTDLDVPFVLAVEDLIDDVLGERRPTRTGAGRLRVIRRGPWVQATQQCRWTPGSARSALEPGGVAR
jgi:hypothetical protein